MGKVNERYETPNGHGRVDMSMSRAEYAAGLRYGRERGINNIWAEPEFREDVKRLEADRGLAPRTISRRLRISTMHREHVQASDSGRLTRFGRATFSKSYA